MTEFRVPEPKRWHPFLTTTTQKQVTANMTEPREISERFTSNIAQKQLRYIFLNISQRHYKLFILGTLDISGYFRQKR